MSELPNLADINSLREIYHRAPSSKRAGNRSSYDAVIVGSGPNGLSAGIMLAQAGCSVLILEARDKIGGGVRTDELTLPGFQHDSCAAIFPLSLASPFFRTLPLEKCGLEWIHSPAALAHPLDDGSAVLVRRSLQETAEELGADGRAYKGLMEPLLEDWDRFSLDLLGPLPFPPRSISTYLRFSLNAVQPAVFLAKRLFKGERARAFFGGMAGHSLLPLEKPASGAFGVVVSLLAHAVGWPFPKGGAQSLSRALGEYFQSLGGEILTGYLVESLEQLPLYRVALFDVAPRNFLRIVGSQLSQGYRQQLMHYRYGPGVFKIDFALSSPVPWQSEACYEAATLHLGGSLDEIAASEREIARGVHPKRPYVLVAQTTLFDSMRAPEGMHTLWAYCHVPNGSTVDMSERIEAQIERFAPGFGERILARHTRTAVEMEAYNPNYVGGDINTGVQDLFQLFTRPAVRLDPYSTSLPNVFLCSSATPPGGGVHGMSGYHAARSALRRLSSH